MPHLSELNGKLESEGFRLISVLIDVSPDDSEMMNVMNTILEKTGADYLQVFPSEETYYLLSSAASSVPTAPFIDRNGNPAYDPIAGAGTKEQWETIITEMLSMVQ